MAIKKSDTFEQIMDQVNEQLGALRTTGKGSRARLGKKLVSLGEKILAKFPPQTRA